MHPPFLIVGRITGAFGVKGWVRINSFTSPENNLFALKPLQLVQGSAVREVHINTYEQHDKGFVALFDECPDRDIALSWRGAYLQVSREQLPALPEGQYYWADLEGAEVINLQGKNLGQVDHLFNTGANDIMAIKNKGHQFYIPFIQPHVVKEIDLTKKIITVDWEEDNHEI